MGHASCRCSIPLSDNHRTRAKRRGLREVVAPRSPGIFSHRTGDQPVRRASWLSDSNLQGGNVSTKRIPGANANRYTDRHGYEKTGRGRRPKATRPARPHGVRSVTPGTGDDSGPGPGLAYDHAPGIRERRNPGSMPRLWHPRKCTPAANTATRKPSMTSRSPG